MMEVKFKRAENCRACHSSNLKKCLTLKEMPLTDDLRTQQKKGAEFLSDIEIFTCEDCGLTQLLNEIDLSGYYNNYGYTASNSGFAQTFMKSLVNELFTKFDFGENSKVLEVGSGDGAQLSFFKQVGANVYGVEPSEILCDISRKNGIPVHHGFFGSSMVQHLPEGFNCADIVLLTYTFDHMPNPGDILESAREILNPESGLLVLEIHDLDKIIDRKEFCLFAHEHYIYLTKNTLTQLLRKHLFEPVTFDLLPDSQKRGNSLLVAAKPIDRNQQLACDHENMQLEIQKTNALETNIKQAIERIDQFIKNAVKNNKQVAGYGAGGRGVMTLAALKNSQYITYVCDQNESFHGFYTPKSNIEIVSSTWLKEKPVDVLLVFSFGYINEIIEQVSEYNPNMKIVSILDVIRGYIE